MFGSIPAGAATPPTARAFDCIDDESMNPAAEIAAVCRNCLRAGSNKESLTSGSHFPLTLSFQLAGPGHNRAPHLAGVPSFTARPATLPRRSHEHISTVPRGEEPAAIESRLRRLALD